ncbi:MAG TPA: phosphoribosylaminoimidazolesuccinocarboxamide synthase, partial [Thermotogaceae bacterium]|nr:phosphoribosylaminoimidazolesuccinocarboxamide synthase [Thermotogaceae bacterium]
MKLLYEGKAKKVWEIDDERVLIEFKDDVTAFDGLKKDQYKGKGFLNKKVSDHFFEILENNGIKTHYIKSIDDRNFEAWKTTVLPLEVVVRNYTAGSFCRRYGVERGKKLSKPLVEFMIKSDELHDPLICEDSILLLNLVTEEDLKYIKETALKVNEILSGELSKANLILADFKLEFGKKADGEILLIDEITPDTCRFWDSETLESLDKDVYREDKADLLTTYEEVVRRLG